MEKEIKTLVGEYIQVRTKDGKYINKRNGIILKTTPISFIFETKCDISGTRYKNRIKFRDVIEIKKWENPICPLCKSVQINDFTRNIYDGPNKLGTAINCCVCINCGILFINKNDRNQCLWNS